MVKDYIKLGSFNFDLNPVSHTQIIRKSKLFGIFIKFDEILHNFFPKYNLLAISKSS